MGFSDPMYFDNTSYCKLVCVCCSRREPYQNPADGVYDTRCVPCQFSCVDGIPCHYTAVTTTGHSYGSKCPECGTEGSVRPGDDRCVMCQLMHYGNPDPRGYSLECVINDVLCAGQKETILSKMGMCVIYVSVI
jgi:hypothetical protein